MKSPQPTTQQHERQCCCGTRGQGALEQCWWWLGTSNAESIMLVLSKCFPRSIAGHSRCGKLQGAPCADLIGSQHTIATQHPCTRLLRSAKFPKLWDPLPVLCDCTQGYSFENAAQHPCTKVQTLLPSTTTWLQSRGGMHLIIWPAPAETTMSCTSAFPSSCWLMCCWLLVLPKAALCCAALCCAVRRW
jgi:hypothetical protein